MVLPDMVKSLSDDVLISHGGPVIMRDNARDIYRDPGTLVLWKWLGFNRFFPPDRFPPKEVNERLKPEFRGCASVSPRWKKDTTLLSWRYVFGILYHQGLPRELYVVHVHELVAFR